MTVRREVRLTNGTSMPPLPASIVLIANDLRECHVLRVGIGRSALGSTSHKRTARPPDVLLVRAALPGLRDLLQLLQLLAARGQVWGIGTDRQIDRQLKLFDRGGGVTLCQ